MAQRAAVFLSVRVILIAYRTLWQHDRYSRFDNIAIGRVRPSLMGHSSYIRDYIRTEQLALGRAVCGLDVTDATVFQGPTVRTLTSSLDSPSTAFVQVMLSPTFLAISLPSKPMIYSPGILQGPGGFANTIPSSVAEPL